MGSTIGYFVLDGVGVGDAYGCVLYVVVVEMMYMFDLWVHWISWCCVGFLFVVPAVLILVLAYSK